MEYDRRVALALAESLTAGQELAFVVGLAKEQPGVLDLQFRAVPGRRQSMLSLYAGTTVILYLEYDATLGTCRLRADKAWANDRLGWNQSWAMAMSLGELSDAHLDIARYIHAAVGAVESRKARFLTEGRVQSLISSFTSDELVVIDREAVFAKSSDDFACREKVLGKLKGAVGLKPDSDKVTASECDTIAISSKGEVLAIEVKPRRVAIKWAPLQATYYAMEMRRWVDQDSVKARETLLGMYEQRHDAGLANPTFPVDLPQTIVVRPVVAIEGLEQVKKLDGLRSTVAKLEPFGFGVAALEVCSVDSDGRLTLFAL